MERSTSVWKRWGGLLVIAAAILAGCSCEVTTGAESDEDSDDRDDSSSERPDSAAPDEPDAGDAGSLREAAAPPLDAGDAMAREDTDAASEPDAALEVVGGSDCAGVTCGAECCREDEVCSGGERCVPEQDACSDDDDCEHDTFCDDGECVAFGAGDTPSYNEDCVLETSLSAIEPVVQCHWDGPPESDPNPTYNQVMATTIVVDLDLDDDSDTLLPSIAFATFPNNTYHAPGVLRVISGSDCSLQLSAMTAEDAVNPVSPVAAGDLDGDGRPEIVAAAYNGGVLAFKVSDDRASLERLWRSGQCEGDTRTEDTPGALYQIWPGPSLVDLDDDGRPEVLYGGIVYGADGCIRSASLGFPSYSQGVIPVALDVDSDGAVELVMGNGLYEWDRDLGDWVPEATFSGSGLGLGQVAVAELGDFPVEERGGEDFPEIAVVSSGQLRVQTVAGQVVYGPVAIPGGGVGGAPTIADFDGDGRPEIASAGGRAYAVFDLDCVADSSDGCASGRTDGILWSQTSQDATSNVTGSSVFDFDGDGRAEVAYADECYFRIYDGATGTVAASVGNTSATTYENPVIADTDGDFRSEIVISANDFYAASLRCPATDPLRPITQGAATHGVFVFRDAHDAWAASRPIWNQHAYSVTNVTDDGTIVKTSDVQANWQTEGLNDFRRNSQGELNALGLGDLTVSDAGSICRDGETTLRARLCNRGTLPVPPGTEVAFTADDELCRAASTDTLQPGGCSVVECSPDMSIDPGAVTLTADPDDARGECLEGNNRGRSISVRCR